jgi:hypothetical protein
MALIKAAAPPGMHIANRLPSVHFTFSESRAPMLKKITAVAIASLWIGMASSAQASTVGFANSLGQGGGTLSFGTGAGDVLSVTNAVISGVANLDTAVGTAIDDIGAINCGAGGFGCLTFTTGAFISTNGVDTATYAAGGSLSITGEAVGVAGAGTSLYTSVFALPVTIQLTGTGTTATVQGTLAGGTLDPFLAAFLGVLPNPVDGNVNSTAINVVLTFDATGLIVTGGSGTISLSDVVLTTVDAPGDVVPEPGSMMLLGTGLFGLAASARRKLRNRK